MAELLEKFERLKASVAEIESSAEQQREDLESARVVLADRVERRKVLTDVLARLKKQTEKRSPQELAAEQDARIEELQARKQALESLVTDDLTKRARLLETEVIVLEARKSMLNSLREVRFSSENEAAQLHEMASTLRDRSTEMQAEIMQTRLDVQRLEAETVTLRTLIQEQRTKMTRELAALDAEHSSMEADYVEQHEALYTALSHYL
eukprot:EC816523.1.p1 GENE.EC816523.1~~EC816523.1.p1  ORF type:complete len:209 (+),score=93.58 EC816523.1:14-640(+)